jgi:hypothetical protein
MNGSSSLTDPSIPDRWRTTGPAGETHSARYLKTSTLVTTLAQEKDDYRTLFQGLTHRPNDHQPVYTKGHLTMP